MWTDRPPSIAPGLSRRRMLDLSFSGLGGLALAAMLNSEAAANAVVDPLAPKPQHFAAKAKACIFIYFSGGVSQMDTFDYKPELQRRGGQSLPARMPGVEGQLAQFLDKQFPLLPSPHPFERRGESGRLISSRFERLGDWIDDMAFMHGIKGDSNNHGPSTMHVNTGSVTPGNPSVGAWVSYGLGSENSNLPGYMVLHDQRGGPVNGSAVWQNGYLPASYQGTPLRVSGSPILYLSLPEGGDMATRRRELDLLQQMNQAHAGQRTQVDELEARIASYELAYRMQTEAPAVVDLSQESDATRALYGLEDERTAPFGRQCLLARRLIERGVRFILLIHGQENGAYSWDHHRQLDQFLSDRISEVDAPLAGLFTDLKSSGLWEETLVVGASEMGRTPFIQPGQKVDALAGRNHNQYAMMTWFAGAGVRGGADAGGTDDFGLKAAEEPIPMRDMHATVLHLLGLDQKRLTYLHEGRYKQLTDFGGQVRREVIA